MPFELSDSSGVELAVSSSPTQMDSWTISELPIHQIPSIGSGYELFQVSGLQALSLDRLVLANGGSQQVLVFDLDDGLIRTIGGPGDGPGEFGRLQTVLVGADETLVAVDLTRQSLIHFDTLGTHLRTIRIDHGPEIRYAFVRDTLTGGRFLGRIAHQSAIPGSARGLLDIPREVIVIESDGQPLPPVLIGSTWYFHYEFGGRLRSLSPALRETWYLAGFGDRVLGVTSSSLGILEFSLDGSLRRNMQVAQVPRDISGAEWAEVIAEDTDIEDQARAAAMRRAYAEIPPPTHWPSSDDLLVDTEGYGWVKHFTAHESDVRTWTVFDLGTGRWVTDVDVPAGLDVQSIDEHRVLGVRRSELGEESVEVYSLVRGRP